MGDDSSTTDPDGPRLVTTQTTSDLAQTTTNLAQNTRTVAQQLALEAESIAAVATSIGHTMTRAAEMYRSLSSACADPARAAHYRQRAAATDAVARHEFADAEWFVALGRAFQASAEGVAIEEAFPTPPRAPGS